MSSVVADRSELAATIDAFRAFNRFHSGLIGTLDYAGRLGTPYSLTEARVLYELARPGTGRVPELRETLRTDRAHLSRVLSRLEGAGLVTREPDAADRRVQVVRLTGKGREAAALLDRRSHEVIGEMVGGLDDGARRRLTRALRTVREVFDGRGPAAVTLRGPRPGELGWVVQRNGAVYAEQFGWNAEYEALVARIVADFAGSHDPDREALWIAELFGEPVGCVFCVADGAPDTARLRLLLVEPWARGNGIGGRLVARCVDFARAAGYRELVLWTNDVLTTARVIYERAGFELVRQEAHHSFGRDLVGQDWRLVL